MKTLLDLQGSIPINLEFIFDGEEEYGSPNLKPFMVKHKEMLQADLIYRSDGPLDSSGAPIINLGGRGMVSLELTATGADRDHHSGNKGNIVPNPAWKLIDLLSALRTPDGTVQVEGFYDDVRALSERDLEIIRSNYFDADEKAKTYGLKHINEYIGTGPFKFEEWKQDQYIHLTRFEDYQPINDPADGLYGKKEALVNDLYLHYTPDSHTTMSGLMSGEYDIASSLPIDGLDQLKNNENIKIDSASDNRLSIYFNKKKGLFANPIAREAIAIGLNNEDIFFDGLFYRSRVL